MDDFENTLSTKLINNQDPYKEQKVWSNVNRKAYNQKGKSYDFVRPLGLYKYLSKYFRKIISTYINPGDSILDAGCGTGNSTYFLDNCVKGCDIKGIDQAQKMLKVAQSKNFRNAVSFKHSSIEMFDSEYKFDAVHFFQVIHHFKDIGVALSLSERVVKQEGFIFFIDFFSKNPIIKFLNLIYCKFLGQGKYEIRDFNKIKSELKMYGYKVIKTKTHPVLMNYSLVIAKKM